MRAELIQRPIGDVLTAICPVLVVGVEGEALCFFEYVKGWNHFCYQGVKRFVTSNATNTNHPIFRFSLRCREDRGKDVNFLVQNPIKEQMCFCKGTAQ